MEQRWRCSDMSPRPCNTQSSTPVSTGDSFTRAHGLRCKMVSKCKSTLKVWVIFPSFQTLITSETGEKAWAATQIQHHCHHPSLSNTFTTRTNIAKILSFTPPSISQRVSASYVGTRRSLRIWWELWPTWANTSVHAVFQEPSGPMQSTQGPPLSLPYP